jgi:hypothetical protein
MKNEPRIKAEEERRRKEELFLVIFIFRANYISCSWKRMQIAKYL